MKTYQGVAGIVLLVAIVLVVWHSSHGRPLPQAAAGLPDVLVERGFGGVKKPVTLVWTPHEGDSTQGAVTLAGTDSPAPMGTTWVFADPTPVWLCFVGIKTRTFEEGTYTASEPILVLRLGDPPDGGAIGFESRPGYGDFSPPKHYPDGGYWTFDPELLGRLCQLLSSAPPTKVGTPRR